MRGVVSGSGRGVASVHRRPSAGQHRVLGGQGHTAAVELLIPVLEQWQETAGATVVVTCEVASTRPAEA